MHWRRTDPVQDVGAILLLGADAGARLEAAMSSKPAAVQAAPVVRGENWLMVFGVRVGDSDDDALVLPRVERGLPLYQAPPGWWLPVGIELDAPAHASAALSQAVCARYGFELPAIAIPRLSATEIRTREADIYLVRQAAPFRLTRPIVNGGGQSASR